MSDIVVTAASGVEGITKKELYKLGITEASAINGKIAFSAPIEKIAELNLQLRTADKVLLTIGEFTATSFDELFDNVKSLPWEDYIERKGKLLISGKSTKSKLFALSASQSIIKKAILERLAKAYKTTFFPESGTEYYIEFHLFEDKMTISLNTSGVALHKRGYRTLVGDAPLRETLACCLLMLSDWSADKPLIDPFCGSGTLPIEAARMALNIPAGYNRSFAFEKYSLFNENVLTDYKDMAREKILDVPLRISGFDINPKAVKLALAHAKASDTEKHIHLQVRDVAQLSSRFANGVIVTNPPYGERLCTLDEVAALYKTLGEVYRKLDNWSLHAITSAPNFERSFGKKADKNRKLYNSTKECRFYSYFQK